MDNQNDGSPRAGVYPGAGRSQISRPHATQAQVLILDLTDVTHIDTSGALALEDIIVKAGDMNLAVHLVGLRAPVHGVLERLEVLDLVAADRLHVTRLAALRSAAETISNRP